MIKSLTPEQEAQIPSFIKKWVDNSFNNNNREAARESVSLLYTGCKIAVPRFAFARSPKEGILVAAIFDKFEIDVTSPEAIAAAIEKYSKRITKEEINKVHQNILYSQWYSSWCGWFDYAKHIGVEFDEQKFTQFYNFCESVFACIPFTNICFIIDKPIEVHLRNNHLHNSDGPSVLFSDGYGIFSLNGVRVPPWVVQTPAEDIDPVILLKEKNAEIRRELVRKVGIERVLDKLDSTVVDTYYGGLTEDENKKECWIWPWNPEHAAKMILKYELLELKLPGMTTKARYLKMKNPSIGTYHIEGVPSTVRTCEEALSWRCGGVKWAPKQLS